MRKLAFALLLISSFASLASGETGRFELQGNRLLKVPDITFETGKATLRPSSDAGIDFVKRYLVAKPYISTLRIEVHSDNSGDEAANQKLTEQRALAVGRALVGKGIDCKRLLAVGFGSTKPIADNKTAEGRAANRRTAFENAGLKGRAIGGMPMDGGGRVAGDLCAP